MFRRKQKPTPVLGMFIRPKPKPTHAKTKTGALVGAIVGTGMYFGLKNKRETP